VILWVQCDTVVPPAFGSDGPEDKESWRAKHMCRSSGAEIYDLAWSPDSAYFIIGSMDNIARIYSSSTGALVRQVAEHSHYVQGVAWDPLNEYIATQSSDRSVHIYSLRTKDGQYTLTSHDAPSKIASHSKADLPPRRISSSSPAPPEFGHRSGGGGGGGGGGSGASSQLSSATAAAASTQQLSAAAAGSPVPSAPGTPTSMALPMNPPSTISHGHSRRSSLSSRRSLSPAPSMPLPAVMPMEASPKPLHSLMSRNSNIYLNETLTSFFRRLTFTPDGSLLLTPSGQYQSLFASDRDARPSSYETTNTVYIYSRGGINKPPIGHLPGHKKPTIAVKCSPVIYTLRPAVQKTRHITIDSSSAEDPIASLPEPVSKAPSAAAKEAKPSPVAETKPSSFMEPPPPPTPSAAASDANAATPTATTPKAAAAATPDAAASSQGPIPTFALPYRIVYAVATQESVLLYDTQQKTPLCVVSNLHCATFTDLAW
jgi:chromatin assembly factor 1 subunit B